MMSNFRSAELVGRLSTDLDEDRAFADILAGLGPNGVVMFRLPSGPFLVGLSRAAFRAGLVQFQVSMSLPPSSLAISIERAVPDCIITDGSLAAVEQDYSASSTNELFIYRRRKRHDRSFPPDSAYLVNTTGSTGTFKTSLIRKSALDRHVNRMSSLLELSRDDVVLQCSAPGFDVWYEEVFTASHVGAKLFTTTDGLRISLSELDDIVINCGITVLNLTASYWQRWTMRSGGVPSEVLGSLRAVIIGSEPVNASTARTFLAMDNAPRLISAYGLSETTITNSTLDVSSSIKSLSRPILPLGEPLPGCIFTMETNAKGQQVLVVSGGDQHHGYVGPDRSLTPGGGRFVTGDVVEMEPTGLYLSGRTDDLIKVSGQRVSLLAVESVIQSIPAVAGCAVVSLEDEMGSVRIRCVIQTGAVSMTQDDVRNAVSSTLGPASAPQEVLFVDSLPVSSSGKVDRNALRTYSPLKVDQSEVPLRLHTDNETAAAKIAGVASELLGRPVLRDEDLLGAGLNSLSLLSLVDQIERLTGVSLSLRDAFSARTCNALGALVATGRIARRFPAYTSTFVESSSLTRQQFGVWFHTKFLQPGSVSYNCQSSIRFAERLDIVRLTSALSALIQRNDVYRLSFKSVGADVVQTVHDRATPILEVVETDPIAWCDLRERFIQEPFDLERPPLMRWMYLEAPDGSASMLVVAEHHLVHDGYSFALFLRQLIALYNGEDPPGSGSYLSYAVWQREFLASALADEQRNYWRDAVVPLAPLLEAREVDGIDGAPPMATCERSTLPESVASMCRRAARVDGTTLFAQCLAALGQSLSRVFGKDEFYIGVGSGNRRLPETRTTLGMFVNVLPVRISQSETGTEFVHRTGRYLISALDNQELPFGEIVRALNNADVFSSENPIYQVLFGFDDVPVPPLSFGGARGTLEELQNGSAKLPLTIIAVPRLEQRVGQGSGSIVGDIGDMDLAKIDFLWEFDHRFLDATKIKLLREAFESILLEQAAALLVETPGMMK